MSENTIGKIIRELRLRKGKIYSLSKVSHDLSKLADRRIAMSTLASWETGRSFPDLMKQAHIFSGFL
jgi:transcriptional regulator with XRE-family HTH domain